MSDKQTLKAMFERAGVVWEDDDEDSGDVLVRGGAGPCNLGSDVVCTYFSFDDVGELIHMGSLTW